jgi:hypothetical protein
MTPSKTFSYLDIASQFELGDTYIKQVFDYYHQCFLASDWACVFVETSALIPEDLREHSFPCLCNRSIGKQVDSRRTLQGGAIRGALKQNDLLLSTGGELFRGCIVFPEIDSMGRIVSATGYRYAKRIRRGQQPIIEWQRPEPNQFVAAGMLAIKEVIHEKAHF